MSELMLPAGIDWEARWRDRVRRREAQTDVRQWSDVRPGSDFWERRADNFAQWTFAADITQDPLYRALDGALDPTWTLLDVGAGVGRHAAPLAKHVHQVIAVEPSPALARRLRDRVAELGLTNVEVVASRWEDASVPPIDVAICANVLYPIAEAGEFLRKLIKVVRRRGYIVHRAMAPPAINDELWLEIHGEPRVGEPTLLDLYGLLCQLGVHAEIRLYPMARRGGWPDLDAAVADCLDRLALPPNSSWAPHVRQVLAERLDAVDGNLVTPTAGQHQRVAIVSWSGVDDTT